MFETLITLNIKKNCKCIQVQRILESWNKLDLFINKSKSTKQAEFFKIQTPSCLVAYEWNGTSHLQPFMRTHNCKFHGWRSVLLVYVYIENVSIDFRGDQFFASLLVIFMTCPTCCVTIWHLCFLLYFGLVCLMDWKWRGGWIYRQSVY